MQLESENCIEKALLKNLTNYKDGLLSSLKTAKVPQWVDDMKRDAKMEADINIQMALQAEYILVAVPSLFKEDVEEFVSYKMPEGKVTPFLSICRSAGGPKIQVFLDGKELFVVSDLVRGFAVLLSLYFIFNLAVPKPLAKSLSFYFKFLCGINWKVNLSVNKVALKLKK